MFRFDRPTVIALCCWVILWVAFAFAVPQLAKATGWKQQRAQAIAAKAWGNPCAGRVTVRWATETPDAAGWFDPDEPCTVYFNAAVSTTWWSFCTTMIHEYGHVAGYRDPANAADPFHSHNEDDIMAPSPNEDSRCDDRGRPYLRS